MFENNLKKTAIDHGEVSASRLETLVDGIFAIAMTLLVLEIHLPAATRQTSTADFASGLISIAPHLLSFALSFIILGMFWVAHHTEFRYIKKVDNVLIWLNIFYLLLVSLLPFSAALLGQYYFQQLSVIIYGVHLTFMVLLLYFNWRHVCNTAGLLQENVLPEIISLPNKLCFIALVFYAIALAFSFWHLEISLIIYAFLPLPYIFGWIYRI